MKALGRVSLMLAGVLFITEISMRPTGEDRLRFAALFGAIAFLALLTGFVAPYMIRRFHSLRHAIAAPGLLGVSVAAIAVVASAALMFVSSHDLTVFLIALAFAVGLATVVTIRLSEDLERDLLSINDTLRRVAAGQRNLGSSVDRPDELGIAAGRLDRLTEALADAETARARTDLSRDRMLSALSHDLRTPLTAMRVAVEALQDGVADDPVRYLGSIDADLRALTGLVDDLFLLTRMERGAVAIDPQTFDLFELADEAVEALTPVAAQAGISIDIESHGNLVVQGAARELGRAIRNLIDNAVRYSPRGSTVRVLLTNGGPTATLRVMDEGPGFPPGFRESACEEFTKGDPARCRDHGGAGLGLAIVKSVVEAHEGSLWIEEGSRGSVAFQVPVARTSAHTVMVD